MNSEKKKILLVTRPIAPPWDEASKNFAFFVAKNITGVEIHLMTKGTVSDLPSETKQHPIYTSSEIAGFNTEQKLRSLFFQLISRGKFDINHYFFTPTRLNSFLIKSLLSSKKTLLVQTVATIREDLWSDRDLKKLLFGDMIITYSDYAKNKLERLGYTNVKRIYPGIDVDKFSPSPKDLQVLERFGLKETDFVITYPGEYVRLGATDDIVESLPEIFRRLPSARFIFANRIKNTDDLHKKNEVKKMLEEKGLLDKVVMLDETFSEMPRLYNISDIVVFPVRDMKGKFDVPLAVIEAMSCEKPVIISDLPILAEFAKESNSVPMESGNFNQFVEKIVSMHDDPQRAATLGRSAREYVKNNFDIRKIVSLYSELYKNL